MSQNTELKIDWASHEAALYAVTHWHYSKCLPAGKVVKIGVWENAKFIGVVLFSHGATNHLGTPYGLKETECCELTRIALNKHDTPVSRIVSIAFKFLRKNSPGPRLVISFADPDQKHHGGIYQAGNWVYTGKSPDTKFPVVNGKLTHPRTLSILVKNGTFKKRSDVPHVFKPGKHRYLMPLDEVMRKQVLLLSKPYPKRVINATKVGDTMRARSTGEKDGASPISSLQSKKSIPVHKVKTKGKSK